ncbi:MAG: medium chain dehydrogenase/reductase family protein [Anaerolineaceae bacterium]|nr:medium chain dehydrogenase/reductase family protein [Anaerolineaceae bacterium]
MKFKSIIVTKRGGPEVLQVIEKELREPSLSEARIRVLAVGVGRTDINYRYGYSPFSPKVPFVPGYEIMGVVDAIGQQVTRVKVGDRVAALIGHGGYSEIIYLGEQHLVIVPPSIAPADAVVMTLNYVSAYQMLHRVARVKAGDKVLLIGASGGIGTALLQLCNLAGLKMYGTASPSKFNVLTEMGAIPIDYHHQDFVEAVRQLEPGGLDFVFDGMGGKEGERGLAVLRRGGKLVGYAAPVGLGSLLLGMLKIAWTNLLPNGKSVEFYGITVLYMRDKKPFMQDLPLLFNLLLEGKIKPLISAQLPLLEARKANELLEGGQISGNIVLLSQELS